MITLYTFGRRFGLPDPSPFVCKAEVLLKMAGLEHRLATGAPPKAPKGKLPYIDDDGEIIADSTFIRWHLERRHKTDFDAGLTAEQKALGWALERMCEDHLYWALLDSRWLVDANYEKGARRFLDFAPVPLRPLLGAFVRRQFRRNLWGHGLGRHARADIERLAARDLDAIAVLLGARPWLFGEEPKGADATVWSFAAAALTPYFESPIRDAAARHANLVAYRDRGMQRWFPELG